MKRTLLPTSARWGILGGLGLSLIIGAVTSAKAAIFTSLAAFQAELTDSYTETYNGMTSDNNSVGGPLPFSSGGFSYQVNTAPDDLYIVDEAGAGYNGKAMSTASPNAPLTYSGFSANVDAVGGDFFLTDIVEVLTGGSLTVTVTYSDLSTESQVLTSPASGTLPFLGFVASAGLNISSLELTTSSGQYVTADNLIAGTAVPEPGAWMAGASVGLLAFAGWRRRRRPRAAAPLVRSGSHDRRA